MDQASLLKAMLIFVECSQMKIRPSVAKKMEKLSFPTIAWYISLDSGAVLGKVTASASADYVFTSQEEGN